MNLILLIQEVIINLTAQGISPTKLTVNLPVYEALTREIVFYGTVVPPVMILSNLFSLTVTVDVESDTLMSFTL